MDTYIPLSQFVDEKSREIYENLYKLNETGDVSYLIKAHSLCGIESDPVYRQHLNLLEQFKNGKKLVLYGLGKNVADFIELEKKRRNTPGYLHLPFLSDIPWYGFYDKDSSKAERFDIMSLTELLEIKEEAYICIASTDYYEEIKSELLSLGFNENNIAAYIYPNTQCYEENQYYDDFLQKNQEKIVIDGGCYRCDSLKRFIDWNEPSGYEKIISFEPDEKNYEICRSIVDENNWSNVELIHAGLSDKTASYNMASNGDDTSYLCEDGDVKTQTVCIDDIINEDSDVSFIKLDVEGFELETLKGAANTIRKSHPRMAISFYHKASDLMDIPKYIMKLSEDYKFYLRIYSNAYLEIVLYAV